MTETVDPAPVPAEGTALQFRCRQCGAEQKLEPGTEALRCASCGSAHDIQVEDQPIVEYDFEEARARARRQPMRSLAQDGTMVRCNQCGAEAVIAHQATQCAYCDSPLVVGVESAGEVVAPESLLPFHIDRDGSQKCFATWIRSRWFAPSDLARRARAAGMDGVYLPYWTYDSATTTRYRGMRGEHYWVSESYTDSKGNRQTRMVRKTRWWPASGTVHVGFDDILVCASPSLPRKLVEALEPWDLGNLKPFEPAFLSGFFAERYQIDFEAGFERARERMEPAIRKAIRRDIGGDEQIITSMNVRHANVRFKHLLLPLWISSFRYKERVFRTMVNARTGEVQGERPWSWIKIVLFILTIVALIGGSIWAVTAYQASQREDRQQIEQRHLPAEEIPPQPEPEQTIPGRR